MTILWLPLIADKIGRKWIFWGSIVVAASAMITLIFSKSLYLTIATMFVAGMVTSGRTSVGYIFANEFFTPKWQVVFGTAFLFLDSMASLIITLYFDVISKHYRYIVLVGIV